MMQGACAGYNVRDGGDGEPASPARHSLRALGATLDDPGPVPLRLRSAGHLDALGGPRNGTAREEAACGREVVDVETAGDVERGRLDDRNSGSRRCTVWR